MDLSARLDAIEALLQQLVRRSDPDVLIPIAEVSRRVNLSERTIARMVKLGAFPSPRHLGCSIKFRQSDVAKFIDGLPTVVEWRKSA